MKVVLPRATRWLPTAALILCVACDESSSQKPAPAEAPPTAPLPPAPPPTASAPEPPRAPDIIVDRSTISIGRERVPMGEPGLANALVTLLSAQPGVAGQAVDVVAMRNAKPSQIEGVIAALETAKAASVGVKTETRDSATARLPISFARSVPDCVTVGWIAKDAAIEVWAAGGGKPKRVIRGLAGPDMTLGTEAMRAQAEGCSASQVAIGADDSMNWGLVFDLGTSALTAPGARASSVVLLPAAVPGKKLTL